MTARLLALFFALCFASAAEAQVVWSIPGSACVPDEATTRFDRHNVGNALVQHAAGNVDLIVLTCPIFRFTPPGGSPGWILRLTYQDSTGTITSAFVRARLFRMQLETATPAVRGTATSNSSPVMALNSVDSSVFADAFDFNTYVYWVRVELQRGATNQTVILHSVDLRAVFVSDVRAKRDVVRLGHLDNGLGFYRFSYNGSDKAYVGVMAQEVEAVMPDAVVRGSDGYLHVFYDRLGLRMQAFEEWVAAGENIPMVAPLVRQ
jgi:hypothetical protein